MNTIKNLDFRPAPPNFDQSGTLAACEIAYLDDGRMVIMSLPVEQHRGACIAVQDEAENWLDSSDSEDVPKIEAILGDFRYVLAEWGEWWRDELDR